MSWPPWHAAAPPLTGVVASAPIQTGLLSGTINPAPAVLPPTGPAAAVAGGVQYSPEQWAQMQQQNWQQWAQWQQQYQQWHQQYGAEYQKSLSALSAAANTNTSVPPPPPNENKPPPPPPPDETGQFNAAQPPTSGYNTRPPAQYTSRPPPTTQFPGRNDWQNANLKRPLLQNPESELANKRQIMENNWNRQSTPAKPGGAAWQNQTTPTTHAQKVLNLEELTAAEKKFDKEFAAWEAQFNKWKEQNVNHPDKTQYLEYEKKWESWRNSLLDRREQMRKKRLALQSTMGKPPVSAAAQQLSSAKLATQSPHLTQPPPQNFSQPPPQLGTNFHKQSEKVAENLFSKPPPTQNNEPLSFKPSVSAPSPVPQNENEPAESGSSFLQSSSTTSGGIPGLDLVKEGVDLNDLEDNPPDSQEAPPTSSKGPDLDAISKGLNSILGDANLLNMLNLVTQKQLARPESIAPVIDTSQPPPKPSAPIPSLMNINAQRSNQSFDDYSESYHPGGHFESVNNFDDQTRMSFTNGPTDQEMSYDGESVTDPPSRFNDFHRGDRQTFGGGRPNGNFRFQRNNSFESQFHNANGQGRNAPPRNAPQFAQPYGNNQNVDHYDSEVNNEQWNEEDEYEKYHSMFNDVGQDVENPSVAQIEPEAPVEEGPMFVPQVVVDYEHKPLREPIPEVALDIIRKFDYRHKPVNRIPYPQRPIWLSSTLRNIQQFDPLGTGRFNSNNDLPRYQPERVDQFARRGNQDFSEDNRYARPIPKERFPENARTESRASAERDYGRQWDRRSFNKNAPKNQNSGENTASFEKKLDLEELSDDEWEDEGTSPSKNTMKYSPPQQNLIKQSQPVNEPRLFSGNEQRKFTGNRPVHSKPVPVQNVTMEDLINPPGRFSRPQKIVIILRGPPGSGKTYLAKLIKDREVENGGSAPRILSLDDYFMVEHEKEIIEDGKRVKIKEMKYEYEAEMEESYRQSLIKSFKKTITDGYFPFVVVDNVNQKVRNFGEMWSFAKQNGFQVYICQLDLDPDLCSRQNIHQRTESYIEDCIAGWEPTPSHHPLVDASTFLHSSGPISEVEMEEVDQNYQDEDDNTEKEQNRSKWDTFDCSLNNLARLDGVNKPLRQSRTMEEYLQLDDEWQEPDQPSKPGQKRVRWADLEEQKQQKKMKALGFVVGQTDWNRLMDPTNGGSALTQTKYIESRYQ